MVKASDRTISVTRMKIKSADQYLQNGRLAFHLVIFLCMLLPAFVWHNKIIFLVGNNFRLFPMRLVLQALMRAFQMALCWWAVVRIFLMVLVQMEQVITQMYGRGNGKMAHSLPIHRLHYLKHLPMARAQFLIIHFYIAGGLSHPNDTVAQNALWSLDLTLPLEKMVWQKQTPVPGPCRMLSVDGVQDGYLYVFSGVELYRDSVAGNVQRKYLKDAYRFHPQNGWRPSRTFRILLPRHLLRYFLRVSRTC